MAPYIALDLFVLNQGLERVGFYHSDYLASVVMNDTQTPAGDLHGKLNCPAEFFVSEMRNLTLFALRAPPAGSMRKFTDELNGFIKSHGFANVVVLSSTMSECKRDRDTNRKIPEVYAYLNNFFYHTPQGKTYYTDNNIKKFGHWLGDTKKKPHQELKGLMGAGAADRLLRAFNRMDIPAVLFVIFTDGSIDFVGGFTYYQFLLQKDFFWNGVQTAQKMLADLKLTEEPLTGEKIHEILFHEKRYKTPYGWAQIIGYF